MPYTILEHIADVRMRVTGETQEELFRVAMLGMMSIIKGEMNEDEKRKGKAVSRTIALRALDKTALLVDFLNDVLLRSHTNKEIYTNVIFTELGEISLEATLEGVEAQGFDEDIKAVTYHEADIRKNEAGHLETILVFDI